MARTRGAGSIYRRKNGLWCAKLQTPAGPKYLYGKTRRIVADKLTELRQRVDTGGPVDPSKMPLGMFLDRWIEDAVRPSLRPRTTEHYEWVRRNLLKKLEQVPLADLDALTLQSAISKLPTARKRQALYTALNTALSQAVGWGLMVSNPCGRVTRPRYKAPEAEALSADQARQVFEAAKGDPLEAMIVLAVCEGLRFGELAGLQRRDVDLRKARLKVERQVVETRDGRLTVATPKSSAAVRTIELTRRSVDALADHLDALPRLPAGFLFTDQKGGLLRRGNFHRRVWAPIREVAGVSVRFHDLRHTAVTLFLEASRDVRAAQARAGHSSAAFTLGTYGHVLAHAQRAGADQLDAMLDD